MSTTRSGPDRGGLSDALLSFVESIASSSSVDELESRYLGNVGRFVPGFAHGLYLLNPFTRGVEHVAARGVSDFFLSRYEEAGRALDPVLERSLVSSRPVDNRQLMSEEQWAALPVYGEVFRLHRMANLMEAPLLADDGAIGTLNFGRRTDEGIFVAGDRLRAEAIARLTAVALAAIRARNALERQRSQVVAALELCDEAIVVTDLARAERRMNRVARALLARVADQDSILDELMTRPARAGGTIRHETPVRLREGATGLLTARSSTTAEDGSAVVTFLELSAPPKGVYRRSRTWISHRGSSKSSSLPSTGCEIARSPSGSI